MPVSEARKKYFFAEGAISAMAKFGWDVEFTETEMVFSKNVDGIEEAIVFKKTKAIPSTVFLQELHFTPGAPDLEEFVAEYIKAYKGNPPLMPF